MNNNHTFRSPAPLVATGAVVLAFAVWLYAPGLHGGFLFDDYANIVENQRLHWQQLGWQQIWQAIGSAYSGPLGRPVSLLSFGLNHLWGGLDPYWFKVVNLGIHLANGLGVFFLARLLLIAAGRTFVLRTDWVALLIASAWLYHPFNLTGVLYVVQRMAELAASFTIGGMVLYVWGRRRQLQGKSGLAPILLAVLVCGPLAILSKENGVLLYPLLFLIEWSILGFRCRTPIQKRALYGLFFVVLLLPLAALAVVLLVYPQWLLRGYESLGFTLEQRVLTEARALVFYARMTLLPSIGRMGLFHDDFTLSTGLFQPWDTWLAALAVAATAVLAFVFRRRNPLVAFGVLFFLVGHSLESTIIPLGLVYEHRNYLPSFGLLLALFTLLLESPPPQKRDLRYARVGIAMILLVLFSVATGMRVRTWSNQVDLALVSARNHPRSLASHIAAARAYLALAGKDQGHSSAYMDEARRHYLQAIEIDRRNPLGYMGLLRVAGSRGEAMDAGTVRTLVELMATTLPSPSHLIALRRLRQCWTDGACRFPPGLLAQLYDALLRNPRVMASFRSMVLLDAARQAAYGGDLRRGAELAREAVGHDPGLAEARLGYADILYLTGRNQQALEQVRRAEQVDKDGFYGQGIARRKARWGSTVLPPAREDRP